MEAYGVLLTCTLIFLARIADVSLGTLRTVAVVNGRRGMAWVLGFFEVLIWIVAVSAVVQNLRHPAYGVAYALGFATGNYLGLTIEGWVAFGQQVLRVFTRRGPEMAARLRAAGYAVTEFDGRGRDGPVHLLLVETRRRRVREAVKLAREADPACYYLVDDIRLSSSASLQAGQTTDWRLVGQKK